MADSSNIHIFPVPPEAGRRSVLNERFPDLEDDPIKVILGADPGAFDSVVDIMLEANMHRGTKARIDRQHSMGEYRVIIAEDTDDVSARLMVEQGTGYKLGMLSVSLVASIGEQFRYISPHISSREALTRGARLASTYAYGLTLFEEISPWMVVDSNTADKTAKSLSLNLLCTGVDTAMVPVPREYFARYMAETLPRRFAAAAAYADLERYLQVRQVTGEEAAHIVGTFMERRIVGIRKAQKTVGSFSISDVDFALANPLSSEEFALFVELASLLCERSIARLAYTDDIPEGGGEDV